METPVTIEYVIGFLTIVGALAGLWFRIDARIAEERSERLKLKDEFTDHKVLVANTYATKAGAGQAIDRAVDEIKGLRADMKEGLIALGDRIERMENHVLTDARKPR